LEYGEANKKGEGKERRKKDKDVKGRRLGKKKETGGRDAGTPDSR